MIKDEEVPFRFFQNKKEVIVNRQFKLIDIMYCSLCEDGKEFKISLDYSTTHTVAILKSHLKKEHNITFDKGSNKEDKIASNIKLLLYYNTKKSMELIWTCPICKREYFWFKSSLNPREGYRHIKKHIHYCEIKNKNRNNSEKK
jgi:hypothetical protein